MSELQPHDDRTLNTDPAQHLDAVCDRFEADWRGGGRPRIEDCLDVVDAGVRSRLLRELVALEIELRQRAGQVVTADEYLTRFPDLDPQWLAALVASSVIPSSRHPVTPADGAFSGTRARRIRCPHCHNPINLVDDKSDEVLCPGCGSSFTIRDARHTDTTSGSRPLGKYQLLERVGLGAFGAVWKSRDTQLDRIVALKIPHTGLLTNDTELQRFHREARAAAQLRHPGIVTVYDVETLDGLPTIVSDFIYGAPLRDLLQTRRLTFRESASVMADIAEAVHYAHSMGVVHRDLKPANILMSFSRRSQSGAGASSQDVDDVDGDESARLREPGLNEITPLITDFGLALRNEAEVTMTLDGHIIGTPAYMSPEQAAGKAHAADARSDVYSLGVIFYELLAGELPFRGSRVMMITQVLHEEPRPPRKVNDKIPRDMETVCLKCLHKEPGRRYQTARELAEDLRRWMKGEPVQARPVGRVERTIKWARRHPAAAALFCVILLTPFIAAAGFVIYNQELERTRKATRATSLVSYLANVETVSVPQIVEEIEAYRQEANPLLRQLFDAQAEGSRGRLHASLALLPVDPSHVDYLVVCLLDATPQELRIIRAALYPFKDRIIDQLWTLTEARDNPARRFRAASALAELDPHNKHWVKTAPAVADWLVAENPIHIAPWTEALRPIRVLLLDPLRHFALRDPTRAESDDTEAMRRFAASRHCAMNILADYASDQPDVLAELLMAVGPKQFGVLFPKLATAWERATWLLTGELDRTLPLDAKDEAKEKLAKRQCNAALALLKADRQSARIWPLLKHSVDPRRRSYLIHRLDALFSDFLGSASPESIVLKSTNEPDVSIQRALILGLSELGQWGEIAWRIDVSKGDAERFEELYLTADDAGLHAAAEWLLRNWEHDNWLFRTNEAWAKDKDHREKRLGAIKKQLASRAALAPGGLAGDSTTDAYWYVNGQGQTMVVIPGPVEFTMGSPPDEDGRSGGEGQHRRRIGRTFAIAAKPVTIREYHRHRASFDYKPRHAPDEECPAHYITWFMAAKYCNWLSEQEGIPRDQWCYETDAEGNITALRANYLSLTGYRLPTEAEWEYACRAGAVTSRYYGESEELLGKYGWYLRNSNDRSWPVGMKKPNDFGVFDMHGSVWNWCQEKFKPYPEGEGQVFDDVEDSLIIDKREVRILRGGTFAMHARHIRCAHRDALDPEGRFDFIGIRPARTIR